MPVADMLAYSPPHPLVTNHVCGDFWVSEEDEEGLLLELKLKQCDLVHRVRRQMAVPNLWKLVKAINEELSILGHLIIVTRSGTRVLS